MKCQKQKESLRPIWQYKLKEDIVISPKIEFKQNQTEQGKKGGCFNYLFIQQMFTER